MTDMTDMTDIFEDDEATRLAVSQAAELLDVEKPGWASSINKSILDMEDGIFCILGQLHPIPDSSGWKGYYHIDAQIFVNKYVGYCSPFGWDNSLIPFWIEAINARLDLCCSVAHEPLS